MQRSCRPERLTRRTHHPVGGPHAIYTCTSETYQIARQWAKENSAILHTHLSETRQEVEECIAEHGVTPLIYLQRIGASTT